ncbi:MAG: hypothetical protein ACRD40_09280 [Candidatus Acidiferrales bacterium]
MFPIKSQRKRARGLSTEVYVEELITTRVNGGSKPDQREAVAAAIDRILERRERHKLDGLKIKDLINEGRKF